jgi:hypothetical protein
VSRGVFGSETEGLKTLGKISQQRDTKKAALWGGPWLKSLTRFT